MRASRTRLLAAVAACLATTALPGASAAAESIGAYLRPEIGYTWVTLKSIEIETLFITAPEDEEEPAPRDPENLDEDDARRPVGRKAYYEGSGLSVGGVAGIRLFDVSIGVTYSWVPVHFEGYSKRYRYDPDRQRAVGKSFYDEGDSDLQRVLLNLQYRLPIWKIELSFLVRFGGIFIDEGPLIMGRSVKEASGFSGDLGIGIGYSATSWLTVALNGWYGFHAFTGAYDGAYGTVGGLDIAVDFHI